MGSHGTWKASLRAVIKWCWVQVLFFTGLIWWAKRQLRAKGAITVLMFHRILDDAEYARSSSLPTMSVRKRTFERLARYLAQHCSVVDLAKGRPSWESGDLRPRVAVTFDDGWSDTFSTALSILQQRQIPLTVFVCPDLVGQKSPFWPERAGALVRTAQRLNGTGASVRALLNAVCQSDDGAATLEGVIEGLKTRDPVEREVFLRRLTELIAVEPDGLSSGAADSTMTWAEIEAMKRVGVSIGSHTQSHEILTSVPQQKVEIDLRQSQQEIEKRLGQNCFSLAYPNGNCSQAIRDIAERTGYKWAFTTRDGAWTEACDPLLIPRIPVWEGACTGPFHRFSRAMLEHKTFWKAYRAMRFGRIN